MGNPFASPRQLKADGTVVALGTTFDYEFTMNYRVWVPPFDEWPVPGNPQSVILAQVLLNDPSSAGLQINNGFHLIWIQNYPYINPSSPLYNYCVPYTLFIDAQFGTWSYDHFIGTWFYNGASSSVPPPWLFVVGTKRPGGPPPPPPLGTCPPNVGTDNAYVNVMLLTQAHKIIETKEFAFGPETRSFSDDLPYPTVETRRWARQRAPTAPVGMMGKLFKRVTTDFGSYEGELPPTLGTATDWVTTLFPNIVQTGAHTSNYNASSAQTRIAKGGINWALLLSAQPSVWNSGGTGFWYAGDKGVRLRNDTVDVFVREGATGGADLGVNFNMTPNVRFDFDLKGVGRGTNAMRFVEMLALGGMFAGGTKWVNPSDGTSLSVNRLDFVPTSGVIVEDPGYPYTGNDAEFRLTDPWLVRVGEDRNDWTMFIEDVEDEWAGVFPNHIPTVHIGGVTGTAFWRVSAGTAVLTQEGGRLKVAVPSSADIDYQMGTFYPSGFLHFEHHRFLRFAGNSGDGAADLLPFGLRLSARPAQGDAPHVYVWTSPGTLSHGAAEFDLCAPETRDGTTASMTWDVRWVDAMTVRFPAAGTWWFDSISLVTHPPDVFRAAALVPFRLNEPNEDLFESLVDYKLSVRHEDTDAQGVTLTQFRDMLGTTLSIFDGTNWGYAAYAADPGYPKDVDGFPGAGSFYEGTNLTALWLKPTYDDADGTMLVTPRVHKVTLASAFRPDRGAHILKVRKFFEGCLHGLVEEGTAAVYRLLGTAAELADVGTANEKNYWRTLPLPPYAPGTSGPQVRLDYYAVGSEGTSELVRFVSREFARAFPRGGGCCTDCLSVQFHVGDWRTRAWYLPTNAAGNELRERVYAQKSDFAGSDVTAVAGEAGIRKFSPHGETRHGSRVNYAFYTKLDGGAYSVMVARSPDWGKTWEAPVTIATGYAAARIRPVGESNLWLMVALEKGGGCKGTLYSQLLAESPGGTFVAVGGRQAVSDGNATFAFDLDYRQDDRTWRVVYVDTNGNVVMKINRRLDAGEAWADS